MADSLPHSQKLLSDMRPVTRSKTEYGTMNEWHNRIRDTAAPINAPVAPQLVVPPTISDRNCHQSNALQRERQEEFSRAYSELTEKIAFRYPNPGYPRIRQGRIGGSWRHIKEVLGHGGSRVVFVDGLVRQYDQQGFNKQLTDLEARISQDRHQPLTPEQVVQKRERLDKAFYKSWGSTTPVLPAIQTPPTVCDQSTPYATQTGHQSAQNAIKYKGFYRLK